MLVNRAVRGEPEPIADLPVRRRHPTLLLELSNEVQNVPLSLRHVFHYALTPSNMGGNWAKVKRK